MTICVLMSNLITSLVIVLRKHKKKNVNFELIITWAFSINLLMFLYIDKKSFSLDCFLKDLTPCIVTVIGLGLIMWSLSPILDRSRPS